MDVEILGPLVVRRDGVDVTIGAAKQRALFTLLVLRRAEFVPIDALIEVLWDGHPPATATKIVHGYVSQLRKGLGDGVLETRPGGYLLRIDPGDVDAVRFQTLLGLGRAALADGDPDRAERELSHALALWRGPALAEFRFHDFAADEIRRLDELRLLALEYRLDAQIALGRSAQAIPELQALVREHPVRENLRRLLMLALYRAGRQADALAAYQDARCTLIEELGIEPGDSLQRLEAAILTHDPAIELQQRRESRPDKPTAAPPAPRGPEPTGPRRPVRRRRLLVSTAALAAALGTLGIVLPTAGSKPHPQAGSGDSLAFVDARGGRLDSHIALAGAPTAVAAGEGAVWVVDTSGNSVLRIDPASHAVVQTVPVGLDPAGIAVGGGSVWVANHDDNTVYRISPESDTVVQKILVGAGPVAVASGYGAIWVTNGYDRTLTRIDAQTGGVTTTIRTNAVGRGVTVGGGSVWVTDEATNRVVGVDPTTDEVASTVTVGTGPTDLDYGAGSLWVVNALAGTVSQVDATTLTVRSTIAVPGGPSAVSVTSGAVWVSAEFASRVYRIDPVRDAIVGSTAVGSIPEGMVSSTAGVWVAARASGTGHRGGRLVVAVSGVLGDSADPAAGYIFGGWGEPTYDALTTLRRVGGAAGTQIVPDLAATLPEPTSDETSYTFQLRPGIRYSDGRPLQAADFRRALQRILEFGQGFPADYSHVVGAPDCGRSNCDLSRGVIVRGASTITFRLSTPDPSLFEELSLLVPVPAGTPNRDVGTTPVPGTGPYAVQTFVPNRLVTFERNRYFHVWSAAARPDGYPDEIVYRVNSDKDDAVHEVLDGHVDLVDLLGEPATVTQLAAQHPGQVHIVDEQSVVFAFLNVRRPPFNDVRVRRALNYAIDRGRAAALYGAGVARPTCQLVPPTVTGYQAYCPYTIDPDAQGSWTAPDLATARSLVAASGTKGQAVTLWAFSHYLPEAKYVVGVLNGLGYRARVHDVSGDYFAILDKTPDVQAGMFGWFGASLAVDMLSTLTCGYDPNPSHFCDPKIDTQIAQLAAREPTDPAGTASLAAGIDRELTEQAPWVPLFTPRAVDVTSARVGDYQTQLGLVLIDQLWVK